LALTADLLPAGWEADRTFKFRPLENEDSSARARYRSTQGRYYLRMDMRYAPDLRKLFTADDALASSFIPTGFLPLDIATHYLVDEKGAIHPNASDSIAGLEPAELRQENGADSHWFWNDGRSFHLSTVVCPLGSNIATRREFSHQLYLDQFHLDHLLPGHPPLFDSRSIIVELSVAQMNLPSDEARRLLEKALHEWYPWCHERF
jgi:cyanosortase A-associated protein